MIRALNIFIFFVLIFQNVVFAQQNKSQFQLHTKSYSYNVYNGSPQIFSITQDKRGVMYFANQLGVIAFDGHNWRTIDLFPETEINAVACDNGGVIYAGGVEEFGYLHISDSGKVEFRSLKHLLIEEIDFKRIYNIKVTDKNEIIFQAHSCLFIYNGDSISVIKAEDQNIFHESFIYNGDYYVFVKGVGLKRYIDGDLELYKLNKTFSDTYIFGFFDFNDEQFVVTNNEGIFKINSQTVDFVIKPDLSKLCHSINIDNNYISVGSTGQGIYLINKDFEIEYILDSENGMLDGVIKCQFLDNEGTYG